MNSDLTRDEISLLIFFEAMAVDNRGIVDDIKKMNKEDLGIAKKWNEEGFLSFKRYTHRDSYGRPVLTYRVKLTDEAILLAHQLRRDRIRRHEDE